MGPASGSWLWGSLRQRLSPGNDLGASCPLCPLNPLGQALAPPAPRPLRIRPRCDRLGPSRRNPGPKPRVGAGEWARDGARETGGCITVARVLTHREARNWSNVSTLSTVAHRATLPSTSDRAESPYDLARRTRAASVHMGHAGIQLARRFSWARASSVSNFRRSAWAELRRWLRGSRRC